MSPRKKPTVGRRLMTLLTSAVVLAVLAVVNRPIVAFGQEQYRQYTINQPGYKAKYGHWDILDVPAGMEVNAIHAALLPTGKVLIIAGSGNKEDQFDAKHFKTLIWDPATDKFKLITTPTDVFCAGHVFLDNGNLLVAGGTKRYEVLEDKVKKAAGPLTIQQTSLDGGTTVLDKGTQVVSPTGKVYRLTDTVTIPAAKPGVVNGTKVTIPGYVDVWVEAVEEGKSYDVKTNTTFTIRGLTGDDALTIKATANKIDHDKQEYFGEKSSYEFDPYAEKYVRVGDLNRARWYPTLVPTADGTPLALSGLDEFGRILDGDTEAYNEQTKKWVVKPNLKQYFPTYPALFLTENEKLFYSGSNAGYGSATKGRQPGIWDVKTNTMTRVPGLRHPELMETSASVLLPPAQSQRVMVLGGGGVGESDKVTARTDIIDLTQANPHFTPGPDLPNPARYLGTVIMPDDTVFTTGGSTGYRGRHDSDLHAAQFYTPSTNSFTKAAVNEVGRNYHSEAILLPDGRVMTLGSDPLYDKTDTKPGTFEKRIEIYTPPYMYGGSRPTVTNGPKLVDRGTTVRFTTPDASDIKNARLVRPSSVTHTTDVEQRSIALDITRGPGTIDVAIPKQRGLVPSGWYMLFVTNGQGIPSVARWVQVK